MSIKIEPESVVDAVRPPASFAVVLGTVLVVTYSVAQGAAVLRGLVIRVGDPHSHPVFGGLSHTVGPGISSFSTLAEHVLLEAPLFVLLVVGLAALAVYHGRRIRVGILLSMTLTLGVFVGVMNIFETVGSGYLFLIVSALLFGGLYGGVGSLLGAGAIYLTQ